MATIRDVAQLAGVSTATVSHVLNGTRAVSDMLKERVLLAMEELQYRPNAVARSLRVSATRTIGLIVPDVEIPFFARVARCIEATAYEAGYSIILCNSNWSREQELHYLADLMMRRIDGLICNTLALSAEDLEPMIKRQTPVVWFEETRGAVFDAVVADNFMGAYEATRHLIMLGHQRIGCITGVANSQLTIERTAGYRQALHDHGLQYDEQVVCTGDYTPPSGLAATSMLLQSPQPPTAVFAFNDMMALGAIQAVDELGLCIPDDVAIIGFDGLALAAHTCPPLSTVEQPIPEMAQAAINLLLARIDGAASSEAHIVTVVPKLIVRASTVGSAPRHASQSFQHMTGENSVPDRFA